MIISIGGKPGSGKSTLAKMLAKKLGYRRYYIGGLRRKMAEDRGMTLQELNSLGEKESWTDREVDEYQRKLGETEDHFIIEGRTSFFIIPHSLKIFIDVDERIGAERVFRDLQLPHNARNEDTKLDSVDAVLASHRKRMASDRKRYTAYYGIDVYDPRHYDFVLDTSPLDVKASFRALWAFIEPMIAKATKQSPAF